MAKEPKAAAPKKSFLTGLYWPCPANPVKHFDEPVAVPIGCKSKCFIRCGCGTNVYFSNDWHAGIGLTVEQCRKQRLKILAHVIIQPTT